MNAIVLLTLAWEMSPSLMLDREVLPKGAADWDFIGLVHLKDKTKGRLVFLFCYDSDTVADKERSRKGVAAYRYPNSFSLHALYKTDSGKWSYSRVYSAGRVRLNGVRKSTTDAVTLELRGNFMIPFDERRGAEINRPFTVSISFVDGALRAK